MVHSEVYLNKYVVRITGGFKGAMTPKMPEVTSK